MARLVRHRRPKGPKTDMPSPKPRTTSRLYTRFILSFHHFSVARNSTRSRRSDLERCLIRSCGMADTPRF